MGAYGSPDLGENKPKKKKLSNPILIVFDAIVLLLGAVLIESLALSDNGTVFSIVLLITFGIIIGLTVGFLKTIRRKISNNLLLLILSAICFISLIVASIID